jgi:hypothetical protein
MTASVKSMTAIYNMATAMSVLTTAIINNCYGSAHSGVGAACSRHDDGRSNNGNGHSGQNDPRRGWNEGVRHVPDGRRRWNEDCRRRPICPRLCLMQRRLCPVDRRFQMSHSRSSPLSFRPWAEASRKHPRSWRDSWRLARTFTLTPTFGRPLSHWERRMRRIEYAASGEGQLAAFYNLDLVVRQAVQLTHSEQRVDLALKHILVMDRLTAR